MIQLIYWRKYTSLGLNVLTGTQLVAYMILSWYNERKHYNHGGQFCPIYFDKLHHINATYVRTYNQQTLCNEIILDR